MTSSFSSFQKLKNPYTFGVPVSSDETFFGREAELRQIYDTLDNAPRGRKQDIVVLGPRRIGKSSLLRRLVGQLNQPYHDFVPAYIDVQAIQPRIIQSLLHNIATRIQQAYDARGIAGLPPMRVLDIQNIPNGLEFMSFNDDLADMNAAIEANDWPRLVLIFDEVEVLLDFGLRGILDWLRSLIQNSYYIVFVVSGSDQVYALTQDYGSPFFNIFKSVELFPLEPHSARALIEGPAASVGMKINSHQVDKLLTYSGNNPYFIQGLAHYLVEELNRQKRTSTQESDVDRAIIAGIDALSAGFFYFWSVATPVQKLFLYTLAKMGTPLSANYLFTLLPDARAALPEETDRREAFEKLVKLQVLTLTNDQYWFVVPLFAEWLLHTIKDDEVIRATGSLPVDAAEGSGLRRLITLVYSYPDLMAMVADVWPEVLYRIGQSTPQKSEVINALITQIALAHRMDELAARVRQDYPEQYKTFSEIIALPQPSEPVKPAIPVSPPPIYQRDQLRNVVAASFTDEELVSLGAELNIDFDSLVGTTKVGKATSLVNLMERYGRLDDLARVVENRVPGILERTATAPSKESREIDLVELRNLMDRYFSVDEVRELTFNLGIDSDIIPQTTKSGYVRELIIYLRRRAMLPVLLEEIRRQRPGIVFPWDEDSTTPVIESDPFKLASQIQSIMDTEQFADLCFRLSIYPELLSGTTLMERILSLVDYIRRYDRAIDLLNTLIAMYPDVNWASYFKLESAA